MRILHGLGDGVPAQLIPTNTVQATALDGRRCAVPLPINICMPNLGPHLLLSFAAYARIPPSWQSPAGALAAQNESTMVNVQLSATHAFGAVAYSIAGGSLPPGVTLSSSGLIAGILGAVVADTTFNFTVRAAAPAPATATADRAFSITVRNVYADEDVIAHLRLNGDTVDLTGQTTWTRTNGTFVTDNTVSTNRSGTFGSYFGNAETTFAANGFLVAQESSILPTGDVTIEFFTKRAQTGTGVEGLNITKGGATIVASSQTAWRGVSGNISSITDRWQHVAIQRQGNESTLFVNGIWTPSGAIPDNNSQLTITGSGGSRGRIDEIRISRIARYSRGFSVPTAPLPVPAGEPLPSTIAFHNRLDGSSSLVGPNGVASNITFDAGSPFGTNFSANFTESSSSYTINPFAALNGSATLMFSVEFWMFLSSTSVANTIFTISTTQSNSFGCRFLWQRSSSGIGRFQFRTTSQTSSSSWQGETYQTVDRDGLNGRWAHVALNRDNASAQVYLDGVELPATSNNDVGVANFTTGGSMSIGGSDFRGRIYDFRMTVGAIRRPFVPPFAPFPA